MEGKLSIITGIMQSQCPTSYLLILPSLIPPRRRPGIPCIILTYSWDPVVRLINMVLGTGIYARGAYLADRFLYLNDLPFLEDADIVSVYGADFFFNNILILGFQMIEIDIRGLV